VKKAEVGKMLKDMQRCSVIKESNSPGHLLSFSSRSKMGSSASVMNYMKLNDNTKKGCFPKPMTHDTGHACQNRMVLHPGSEEWLLAGGITS
jgi:hypothetical protein